MPDEPELDDEGNPIQHADDEAKNEIRGLRKKAKDYDEAAAERDRLRKELLFRDANIDTRHPMATFFMENYAGELTAEAIEAKAKELNIPLMGETQAPDPETTITEEERQSTQERNEFHAGGVTETGTVTTPNPHDVAIANARKVIADGGTLEDGLAAGSKVILDAARQGDSRVVWAPQRDS